MKRTDDAPSTQPLEDDSTRQFRSTLPPELAGQDEGIALASTFLSSSAGQTQDVSSQARKHQRVNERSIIAPPRAQGRLPSDGPAPKRVLVISPDMSMRLYLRARVMLRGHAVLTESHNSADALDLLQRQSFDAVLLDFSFGEEKELAICREIRRLARTLGGKQAHIYILAEVNGVIDKIRAKMAGANAFIAKPLDPLLVAELLKKL